MRMPLLKEVMPAGTITYAVGGKQYVAVMTGLGLMTQGLFARAGIDPELTHAIHVFALSD